MCSVKHVIKDIWVRTFTSRLKYCHCIEKLEGTQSETNKYVPFFGLSSSGSKSAREMEFVLPSTWLKIKLQFDARVDRTTFKGCRMTRNISNGLLRGICIIPTAACQADTPILSDSSRESARPLNSWLIV